MTEKSHVEVNLLQPIVWPRHAYAELESQLKRGIAAQLEETPMVRLEKRVQEAIHRLFVGLRVVSPGDTMAVKSQRVQIGMEVVDTKDGNVIRRRKIDIGPITVKWPS